MVDRKDSIINILNGRNIGVVFSAPNEGEVYVAARETKEGSLGTRLPEGDPRRALVVGVRLGFHDGILKTIFVKDCDGLRDQEEATRGGTNFNMQTGRKKGAKNPETVVLFFRRKSDRISTFVEERDGVVRYNFKLPAWAEEIRISKEDDCPRGFEFFVTNAQPDGKGGTKNEPVVAVLNSVLNHELQVSVTFMPEI